MEREMKLSELADRIGKRVYQIEMAEGMVPAREAAERWDRYMALRRRMPHTCGPLDQIDRTVTSALIAMKEMGLVDYE